MAEVTLKNVSKVYPGGVKAVERLNLHVPDRSFAVIVGPSGCGKSTTLRMVAGLEEVSSGTISIGGRVVNDLTPRDRDVAMVFQEHALYPHLTVYENMAFGLKLRGVRHRPVEARVTETADLLGVRHLLERHPRQLSGGERQRVAVGRAIVRRPNVFLFDEPLSNLDAKMRAEMRVEFKRLHRKLGQTMIYVTHDQAEAMVMGDTIVVMNEGVVHQTARPDELYDRPADLFVAGFVGTPPMNFFRGVVKEEANRLVFDAKSFSIPLPRPWRRSLGDDTGQTVVLGLRPEDMDLEGTALEEAARIPATVDVVEPTGFETHVYLTSGTHRFTCRVRSRREYETGSKLAVLVDPRRAHLFDPATGSRKV